MTVLAFSVAWLFLKVFVTLWMTVAMTTTFVEHIRHKRKEKTENP